MRGDFQLVRSHSCSPTGAGPGHRDNDFHTWHQEYHQRPQDLKSIQTFIVPAWGWRRGDEGTGGGAVGLDRAPLRRAGLPWEWDVSRGQGPWRLEVGLARFPEVKESRWAGGG